MASLNDGRTLERPPNNQNNSIDDQSRIRVAKACSRCRLRKDRCDGQKPSCTACVNAGQQCIYEPTTKKRGLPEGYVRGLEKLLTLATQSITGLEDVLAGYLQDQAVGKSWNAPAGDELYSRWKESQLFQSLESFLQSGTLNSGSGLKRKRTSEDSPGDSSDSLELLLQSLQRNEHQIVSGTRAQTISSPPEVVTIPTAVPASRTLPQVLPNNSKNLLELYFSYIHCWFPVLDRPSVLKAYYSQFRKSSEDVARRRSLDLRPDGDLALLWAIFAYAIIIEDDDSNKRSLSKAYSQASLNNIPTPFTNSEDVDDFRLSHAQALLILALLRLGNGQWLGSWHCVGRATRIMIALQRPKQHSELLSQKLDQNAARAVMQGCFIIECLLNVHFGNSNSLLPAALIRNMINEDGHDEWETWQPPKGVTALSNEPSMTLSIFNRLTRVFLVLADTLLRPTEQSDPVYVQSKLVEVHELAKEHFASGIGSPTYTSPPHHVFFQIGLLFVQLRLVWQVPETVRNKFDLAPLSKNVLGLFEICARSSHIGLSRIPPLYADILELASEVACQVRHDFVASASSPSYSDFNVTSISFRARLSEIWLSFRKPVAQPALSPYWQRRQNPVNGSTTSAATPARAPSLSQHPPFLGYPGTSPSFSQGDEVDAIFHEMAYLDTHEWTNDRAMGFKDFGFSDENAFMEFCNDPARLALPHDDLGQVPLSSDRQSWAFVRSLANQQ